MSGDRKSSFVRANRFVCSVDKCGKEFNREAKLIIHERIHLGVRPFSCTWQDCLFSSVNRGQVIQQLRTRHLRLPRLQTTQTCLGIVDRRDPNQWVRVDTELAAKRIDRNDLSSVVVTTVDTKRPQRINSAPKSVHSHPFVCPVSDCGQSYRQQLGLTRHTRSVHQPHTQPFECTWPECRYVSVHKFHVVTHVRMKHFSLPPTVKEQRQLSITDTRDPTEWIRLQQRL